MKRKMLCIAVLVVFTAAVCIGCVEDKNLESEVSSTVESVVTSSQAPESSQVLKQTFDIPIESEPSIDSTKAVDIALEDAGLSLNKRDFDNLDGTVGTSFDDDGYYKVNFKTNTTEYEYEIDCGSGEIIQKRIESRDRK